MAINSNLLRRPSDHSLFLAAAIVFPLLVLIGYFKTYYFRAFFDVKPLSGTLVHLHGVVITVWVLYFSTQIALVRTKNISLHISMGLAGIALAALVVVTGMAAAYNAHLVRAGAPPGIHPHSFFIIPFTDMFLFTVFFAGAIYFRKRPVEHKALMLMTAINFLTPALSRIRFVPDQFAILWSWGVPDLAAIICLVWHARKHGKVNRVFAAAVLLLIASHPLRFFISGTGIWLEFTGWLASLR